LPLQVLDVHRRPHVDAGVQQLLDVLPPLGVARALHVGVRQLVDQHQLRLAGQSRVEVELLQDAVAVAHLLQLELRQARQQRLGLGAAMGLDDADDDVDALLLLDARGRQHGEGLADARRRAEEQLELAPAGLDLFVLEFGQQAVGVGSAIRHGHGSLISGR